jgi:hypothetical protein
MQMADQIIMRSLESLIPYARNARTHSDTQVAQIAGSMREFGFTNAVLVDRENGIMAGQDRPSVSLRSRLASGSSLVVTPAAHPTETCGFSLLGVAKWKKITTGAKGEDDPSPARDRSEDRRL